MRVYITGPIPEAGVTLLKVAGHAVEISPYDRVITREELLAHTRDVDGMIVTPPVNIDDAFLTARPNVRAVANIAVGFNNLDIKACTAHRVGATNTPGVLDNATAEVAWVLLMSAARRTGEGERMVRARRWTGWGANDMLGIDVVGQTLGIIGAGRIGSRMARLASGFDMKLLYHNRKPSPEMEKLGATFVPMDDLLRQSDFVSLHVPLTPDTRHLIGEKQLGLMKPTAVLVNAARGPVVDEAALVAALKNKTIFAAGLDVYENEPQLHPGLYELENAVLLPHIGSATKRTRDRMSELAATNLLAMLAGKRPPNPINPEIWETK